jgi:TetR/AcrR family transcriptional regulator
VSSASDNTRAELLDRALDLFAAYGYDGVGVQQICDAAGVTKPTLYHHFGSKRGVLETLMGERLAPLYAALGENAARGTNLPAALTAVAAETFAYARRERTFYRLYLTLWFAPTRSEAYEVARRFHERQFEAVDRLVREACADSAGLKARHRALAAAFLGMLNNHVGLALNHYAALNERLARSATHEFLYGVLPQREGARGAAERQRATIPTGT